MSIPSASGGATTATLKRELRKLLRARLALIPHEEFLSQSAAASAHIVAHSSFTSARSVALFVSHDLEFETAPLLRAVRGSGKRCFLPRVEGPRMHMLEVRGGAPEIESWAPNRWGIREPGLLDSEGKARAEACDVGVDLVIVPGLAFDVRGGRLGKGKGYYDRFLSKVRTEGGGGSPVLMAVMLAEQLVGDVPMDERDFYMQFLASKDGVMECLK